MLALDSIHSTSLLVYAGLSVVVLVVLIARFRLHAFVALVLASVYLGLCAGLPPKQIVVSFQEGVGTMLSSIAVVVGLGTILGKLLAESGGAEQVAGWLVALFGERRLPWAMLCIGFIIGLPVFFAVGLVLLAPIAFTLAKSTQRPLLQLGIPLVAGLSAAHGLVPPHPGPIAAMGLLKADPGKTIFWSLVVGFPSAVLAGPIFGWWIGSRVRVEFGELAGQLTGRSARRERPGLVLTLTTILLPVVFMCLATGADLALPEGSVTRQWLDFVGSPLSALLLATLFAFFSFGAGSRFTRQEILKFSEECLAPVATILLVVGAGGGFYRVLVDSGVGAVIAAWARGSGVSPLLFGWLTAAAVRVATGSATVAISTAAGIVAPLVAGLPETNRELLVLAMGAGSLVLSHVNDGGFWFVKEYFNMTVAQTLKTWTMLETILSVTALVLILMIDHLF